MKRARTLWPRLLGAAGLTAALVAVITAFSGTGFSATAAQAQYAPKNVSPPTIQGTATVGNTLTATPGSWTSSTAPTFSYQWLRCDAKGNGCSNIAGATSTTYLLQTADAGNSVRVAVTAKNSDGSSTSQSDFRAVAGATTTTTTTAKTTTTSASKTILASNVTLPDRLTVNSVKSTPFVLRSRRPFVIRFHVVNQHGQSVQGALVYALGLPYSWARNAPEVPTNASGWATIVMRPTSNLPVNHRSALVIFVRARVAGQNLLAGASTRRLVQVSVR